MRRLFILLVFAAPWHTATAQRLPVGGMTLSACGEAANAYCGTLARPLDPAGHVPGTIDIGFDYDPHTDLSRPGSGTIVVQADRAGEANTALRDTALALFGPLRDHHDLLLVDRRGSGRSTPILCRSLQRGGGPAAVRACGAQLGSHAWLYGTSQAAEDLASVLQALNLGPVDFFGVGDGAAIGQVLAARHPALLRTAVFDSGQPQRADKAVPGGDIGAVVPAIEKACIRTRACAAHDGSAAARFLDLLDDLRNRPVVGVAPGLDGTPHLVTADGAALYALARRAGTDLLVYRDIDAAARAWRENGDARPLLRLVAETAPTQPPAPSALFSAGLAQAAACTDLPQLYPMTAAERQKRTVYREQLLRLQLAGADLFAPFQPMEAVAATADPASPERCIAWPAAPEWATPAEPLPAGATFARVPVMVLAGEFDTAASPRRARALTAQFADALFIVMRNTGAAVTSGGRSAAACAASMIRAFVASGGNPGDTTCALRVPPVRAVSAFATRWADVAPARPLGAAPANTAPLSLAAAATETVGDVLARAASGNGATAGLRGGHFGVRETEDGVSVTLDHVRWAADLAVSGTLAFDRDGGDVRARVSLSAAGHGGDLAMAWNAYTAEAQARIAGTVDGADMDATRPAP